MTISLSDKSRSNGRQAGAERQNQTKLRRRIEELDLGCRNAQDGEVRRHRIALFDDEQRRRRRNKRDADETAFVDIFSNADQFQLMDVDWR